MYHYISMEAATPPQRGARNTQWAGKIMRLGRSLLGNASPPVISRRSSSSSLLHTTRNLTTTTTTITITTYLPTSCPIHWDPFLRTFHSSLPTHSCHFRGNTYVVTLFPILYFRSFGTSIDIWSEVCLYFKVKSV